MGRVVAISGGDLKSTEALNRYALQLTEKVEPNVLFMGTASEDAEGYIEKFTKVYTELHCKVKSLCLETITYSEEALDNLFAWADLIYVGGGDTNHMMRMWEKFGIDRRLKEVYKKDSAVLTGISAGAICWFEFGHSDSESLLEEEDSFTWAEGMLGIYQGGFCPHYNEPGRDSFDDMLMERSRVQAMELIGYALENDMAFVEKNGENCFIKCDESAKGYVIRCREGKLEKKMIESVIIRQFF